MIVVKQMAAKAKKKNAKTVKFPKTKKIVSYSSKMC